MPSSDRRYRTKARACRDGRVIDLQITCVPCLVLLALHHGIQERAISVASGVPPALAALSSL